MSRPRASGLGPRASIAAAALFLSTSVAQAHFFPGARDVVVQAEEGSVALLVSYRPSSRTPFPAAARGLMKALLAIRAMQTLKVNLDGRPMDKLEVKLVEDPPGTGRPLLLMLLSAEVPAGARRLTLATRKTWRINSTALDQGDTGTCVGHAWRNFLRCAPLQTEKRGPSPFDIYRGCVLKDAWPDNDDESRLPDGDPRMDSGTSVRAGAQTVTDFGRLSSYVWAFSLQPAVEWVLTHGLVVLGTNWYSSFMRPDGDGIIRFVDVRDEDLLRAVRQLVEVQVERDAAAARRK